MKKYFLAITLAFITLVCCRGDEDDIQTIDQVLTLYVKSPTGQDLLNSKITGSYSSVALLDLLDDVSLKTISGQTFVKDADTVVYMDYPAGAIRLLKDTDTSDPEEKIYYSDFIIRYSKKVNNVIVTDYDSDTIRIEYSWKPSLFQISKLWYNDELKFTKVPGQRNVVNIIKENP